MKTEINPTAIKSNLTLKAIKGLLGKEKEEKQTSDKKTDKKVDVVGIAQKLFSNKRAKEAEESETES